MPMFGILQRYVHFIIPVGFHHELPRYILNDLGLALIAEKMTGVPGAVFVCIDTRSACRRCRA
jgi:hypothetical protein